MSHEAAFVARMRIAGQPEPAIRSFVHYYRQLVSGATGLLHEAELSPVAAVPDMETLSETDPDGTRVGQLALDSTVVIKLNGGLGTSMGMARAKSLLEVKPGASFLDIIARQTLHQRRVFAARLPLLLMNSFRTQYDSLAALAHHPGLAVADLPLGFVQHRVPKVLAAGLAPASWPDEGQTWCPPGHGDLYSALLTSGTLDRLRGAGFRWAFVSNADNLGATLDPTILGYLVSRGLPFLMEVADRTEADRKGGHLAQDRQGRLLLRESAQCAAEDAAAFQDWRRHRFFNTNNLWFDLDALAALLADRDDVLGLPMIRNGKLLVPTDPDSPPVWQLETAMGAALEVFTGAGAIRVPRARFAPVKSTNDLVRLRSDVYSLSDAAIMVPHPDRVETPPVVDLDPEWFGHIDQLERRFPHGPPSLLACTRLTVRGDVTFGRDVQVVGDVLISADGRDGAQIADGSVFGSD